MPRRSALSPGTRVGVAGERGGGGGGGGGPHRRAPCAADARGGRRAGQHGARTVFWARTSCGDAGGGGRECRKPGWGARNGEAGRAVQRGLPTLKSAIEFRRATKARCRADHAQPGPGPHAENRRGAGRGCKMGKQTHTVSEGQPAPRRRQSQPGRAGAGRKAVKARRLQAEPASQGIRGPGSRTRASGLEPAELLSPASPGRFFTTEPPGKPENIITYYY